MEDTTKKMNTEGLSSDIISTLSPNIIENMLTLMPIRDALRTSVLSTKWRYSWRSMPKLVFTDNMVKVHAQYHNCPRCFWCSNIDLGQMKKYKLVSSIFHVLLLHNGPTILELDCSVLQLDINSDFPQIISYLARGNKVKYLTFVNYKHSRSLKLPGSFFSLQGLEHIRLQNCTFEPPETFKGFSRLKSIKFSDVNVSAQMLQRFISKCPLLEEISLGDTEGNYDFVEGGKKFTFVDLFQCVPLIRSLEISKSYMKYLCADGMTQKLLTSPLHLKDLFLEVCMAEQSEISFAFLIIRTSPLLVNIKFLMCHNENLPAQQTPNDFLNPEHYSDLKLDHLETLEIECFSNLPLEMEFVKLIMAKAPVLKKVRINLDVRFLLMKKLRCIEIWYYSHLHGHHLLQNYSSAAEKLVLKAVNLMMLASEFSLLFFIY